jgi:tetratricopeptide (TPR) repeat protein
MSNYVSGSNFSYLDYLQARSFENSLKMEIAQQSKAMIASNEQLRREHITISRSSNQVMTEGFERLSFDLQRLNDGMSELTAAFEWGFSELLAAMGQVNDALAQLLRIGKTPAQTWAYEQFEIAREAFRKQLYPEALEYLNRAINGFGGNTGYKLEYRFHYLLGTIRLGSFKNSSKDIVDLRAAESAFVATARYSREDHPKEAGRAMLAAGWAAYCQGNIETAKKYTNQALSLSPSLGEAYFQLAKIQMHMGEVASALTQLQKAIVLDRLYSVRAASDGDFQSHQREFDALLGRLRDASKQKAAKLLRSVQQELESTQALSVEGFSLTTYANTADAKQVLDEANSAAHSDTYFGYLDCIALCERASIKLREALAEFVRRAKAENQSKIGEVDGRLSSVRSGDLTLGPTFLFFLGTIIGLVVGAVRCGRIVEGRAPDPFRALGAFFGTLFEWSVFFLIAAVVIYYVVKASVLATQGQERERLAAIDSALSKALQLKSSPHQRSHGLEK